MKKKIAILIEKDYEDQEFWYPYFRLLEEGFEVVVVGPEADTVYTSKYGYPAKSTQNRFDALKETWDAVIVPGGWAPDKLRRYPEIVNLVKKASDGGAVIGAICHAGSLLVSAKILKGKRATAFEAIKDDMINAGVQWEDKPAVVDGTLVTSRSPKDLPDYMREIVKLLRKS